MLLASHDGRNESYWPENHTTNQIHTCMIFNDFSSRIYSCHKIISCYDFSDVQRYIGNCFQQHMALHCLFCAKKRSVDTKKRSVDTKKRSVDTKKRSVDTKKRSVDTKKRSVDTKKRSVDTKERSVDTKKRSVDTKKRSVNTKKRSVDTKKAM